MKKKLFNYLKKNVKELQLMNLQIFMNFQNLFLLIILMNY